jgi:hypothetical protein
MMTVTVVVRGYRTLPAPLTAMIRLANSAKALRSRTAVRLYVYDTLLERLAQDLEHLTAELGPFIHAEDAVVKPWSIPNWSHPR